MAPSGYSLLALYRLPDAAQAALDALLTRRADLVSMRVAEQSRLQHPRYALLTASLTAMLKLIGAQLAKLECQIAALIERSPVFTAKFAVMISVKGVGKQTAFVLLACMPELGTLTRKQAAALAGCAPHPRDSGNTRGYRRTAGGRSSVKRALFMAAMAARRFNTDLRPFFERLIQNGKKPMVALTAVMRKLIVILNAKLRDHAYA